MPLYATDHERLDREEGPLNVSEGAGDRVVVVTAHLPSTPSRKRMLPIKDVFFFSIKQDQLINLSIPFGFYSSTRL